MRMVVALILILLLSACDALTADPTVIVKADEVAIVYDRQTGEAVSLLREGTYEIDALAQDVLFYPLFSQVYTFNNDLPQTDETLGVESIIARTSDGIEIFISVTVVFRMNPDEIDALYRRWGSTDYRMGFVRPQVRAALRDAAALTTAADLYQSAAGLQTDVTTRLWQAFTDEGLILERVEVGAAQFPADYRP